MSLLKGRVREHWQLEVGSSLSENKNTSCILFSHRGCFFSCLLSGGQFILYEILFFGVQFTEDSVLLYLVQVLIKYFNQVIDLNLICEAFGAEGIIKHNQTIGTSCGDCVSMDIESVL